MNDLGYSDNSKMIVKSMHHILCLGDNLKSNNENIYFFWAKYGINRNMS